LKLSFEYKDQKAKDKCQFAFDRYFTDKERNLGRLRNPGDVFPRLYIRATDFVFDQDRLIQPVSKEIVVG